MADETTPAPKPAPAARPARGLGRGLAALLGDVPAPALNPNPPPAGGGSPAGVALSPPPAPVAGQRTMPIGWLQPGKYQARTVFDEKALDALAESIRAHGLVQPILVRPTGAPDRYEIVAGERRWRAAQRARLHDVPVVVRSFGDRDALEIGLIENLQRADLSPVETARGLNRLMLEFRRAPEEVAEALGVSRAHVANQVRLLELPEAVQVRIDAGELSMGHARALVGAPNAALLADHVVAKKMSVREAEHLAAEARFSKEQGWDGVGLPPTWLKPEATGEFMTKRGAKRALTPAGKAAEAGGRAAPGSSAPAAAGSAAPKSADTTALERRIEAALGVRAELAVEGSGERSTLTLRFEDFDQLDEAVKRLTRGT